MKINKEGTGIITATACACAAAALLTTVLCPAAWCIAAWIAAAAVTAACAAFFREPDRPLLSDPDTVYAPCDGKVVVCEDVTETEYLGRRCMQVSIFMSLTDVHINWFPVGGLVTYFKHHNGQFMVAWHPKSSDQNEHTTTAVKIAAGTEIVFRQVAGLVAQRIVSYARTGEQAAQNSKCGFIKFGSRVDLYLPLDCRILVKLGQKVTGSQTPIARLKHDTDE